MAFNPFRSSPLLRTVLSRAARPFSPPLHLPRFQSSSSPPPPSSPPASNSLPITHLPLDVYRPLTPQEESDEKDRVATRLTKVDRSAEEKRLDALISALNQRRGVLTGDLYTYRGKFKAYSRDYGFPFMCYWTGCWVATGAVTYGAIAYGDFDALTIICRVDGLFGTNIAANIDPTLGNVAVAIAVNELLEPIRLPFVIATTPTVVRFFTNKN
jgi:hypothetical protein